MEGSWHGLAFYCDKTHKIRPKRYCGVKEKADKLLESAINKLGLSARAYSRVFKVGRTITDLTASENVQPAHTAEATHCRGWVRKL